MQSENKGGEGRKGGRELTGKDLGPQTEESPCAYAHTVRHTHTHTHTQHGWLAGSRKC